MGNREKSQTSRCQAQRVERAVRRPITPEEREEILKAKPRRTCHHCLFCMPAGSLWMQTLLSGFPVTGLCANCADTPGLVRPIPHKPCRNFRLRPFRVEPPDPPDDTLRYIPLTRGLHTIIDAAEYEWLSEYKWQVQPSANHATWYAKRCQHGRLILMHREIMKAPRGMFVDHINGNGLDNRRDNLRLCTPRQNSCNRSKQRGAQHKFIGVQPCGKHTFQAVIMHKGKTYRAGPFDDEIEAAKARDRLALKLHGQFARLNFPADKPLDE